MYSGMTPSALDWQKKIKKFVNILKENEDLVKVWDGKDLIEENIQFLKQPTKKVNFPLSDYIQNIIKDFH